jgi:hypothetical protein
MHALTALLVSYSDGQLTHAQLHALPAQEMHDVVKSFREHWNARVVDDDTVVPCSCDACQAERRAQAEQTPGQAQIPDAFRSATWEEEAS